MSLNNYSFSQEIRVYDYNNGIRDFVPKEIIEKKPDGTYEVYKTEYGIKQITPTEVLIPTQNNEYKVYEVNNGLREINPTSVIKIEDERH